MTIDRSRLAGWPIARLLPVLLVALVFLAMVPIIGLASSALLLDEHLTRAQLIGAALVMGGLAVNVFGGKLMRRVAAQ